MSFVDVNDALLSLEVEDVRLPGGFADVREKHMHGCFRLIVDLTIFQFLFLDPIHELPIRVNFCGVLPMFGEAPHDFLHLQRMQRVVDGVEGERCLSTDLLHRELLMNEQHEEDLALVLGKPEHLERLPCLERK